MSNLYLVDKNFEQGGEPVHQYDHAGQWVENAIQLMRAAADPASAREIEETWQRAFERDPFALEKREIDKLLTLLADFESKLVGTVVDASWMLREEQLPGLRARTTFELDENRGRAALHAVGEAMSRVSALRAILEEAQAEKTAHHH